MIPDYEDECPAGMVLSPETQRCVVDCPEGTYASEDGLCRSYYERECPQGFGRDPDTGRCVPPGLWPPGYDWICLPHCPDGYVRDIERPTRCIPPPSVCPEGFERNGNGRCEPVCEEGTAAIHTAIACRSAARMAPIPICGAAASSRIARKASTISAASAFRIAKRLRPR